MKITIYVGSTEELLEAGFTYSPTFNIYYRWRKKDSYMCKIGKLPFEKFMRVETYKSLADLRTRRVKEKVIQDLIDKGLIREIKEK